MSLTETPSISAAGRTTVGRHEHPSPPRTIESALALLNKLKPKILEMLNGEKLRVPLTHVDIMNPDRGDLEKAHVMWAGPSDEDEGAQKLKRISGSHTSRSDLCSSLNLRSFARIRERRVQEGWFGR